ncbi:MFS transporter [Aquibacillus albus]|uniref:MFS family permease n=1 Tax=Aquibacillus albus TaxID=1168171 RepID=A0ABS2N0N9_9BACI|nr:MFS transporter [Aquibacillus albus]MBM7571679.1 MFS family permease [Aquibacillus albus]
MRQQPVESLWTKSFILLIVGNLFIFMSFQMLLPSLPPYLKSIGASGFEVGLVTALFSIGAVLSRPYTGYILQFKARKSLVLIGAIGLLVITIIYPISQIIILLLLFRFVHGLAWGWSTTVNGTAAVDVVPDSRLGEGMGYYGLSITVGMLVAPSLGIYLFQETSFTNLIYVSGFLGVIAIILLFIVNYPTPEAVKSTRKEDLKFSYFGSLVEKKGLYPALITVMASFSYGSIITFIVIFGEERGIEHIFLYYLLNAAFATLVRPFAGRWFDRRGPKELVIFCSAATFVGMWVLSFAYSNIVLAIAGILFGIGFGTLIPTLQSWTLSITPDNRRGVANGMLFSSIDLGIGLGGVVFGFLALFFEIGTLFQLASFFLIVAIILTLLEGRVKGAAKRQFVS